MEKYGRLTLPTDLDVIDQTIELKNKLGADAIRDCDGTDMPQIGLQSVHSLFLQLISFQLID